MASPLHHDVGSDAEGEGIDDEGAAAGDLEKCEGALRLSKSRPSFIPSSSILSSCPGLIVPFFA